VKKRIFLILFFIFITTVFFGVVKENMKTPKIVLLLNDHDYEVTRASIEVALADLKVDYEVYKTYEGEFPPLNDYDGLIVSGGAYTDAYFKGGNEPIVGSRYILETEVPVLGICMGSQIIAKLYGEDIKYAPVHEWVWALKGDIDDPILENVPKRLDVWENHDYSITALPEDFINLIWGERDNSLKLIKHKDKPIYGIVFHPTITLNYMETSAIQILINFLKMCGDESNMYPEFVSDYKIF